MNTAKLKENVRDFRDQAVDAVNGARDRLVEQSRQAVEHVDQEAHKNPWLFVGVAALFSAIFGFFLGRSSKK